MADGRPGSGIVLYQTEDGQSRVSVRLEGGTVWLTQVQIAELFQTTKQNISLHIKNIFEEAELDPAATVKQYLTVQTEGGREVRRGLDHYNLDMILAIGYRVRSLRGTQFRRWATERLREYLVKGFTLDDARLKEGRDLGADYFDELLERIRDIRASEKRFYQKVRDIYALSIDYDAKTEETQQFFRIVQNNFAGRPAAGRLPDPRGKLPQPEPGTRAGRAHPALPTRREDQNRHHRAAHLSCAAHARQAVRRPNHTGPAQGRATATYPAGRAHCRARPGRGCGQDQPTPSPAAPPRCAPPSGPARPDHRVRPPCADPAGAPPAGQCDGCRMDAQPRPSA